MVKFFTHTYVLIIDLHFETERKYCSIWSTTFSYKLKRLDVELCSEHLAGFLEGLSNLVRASASLDDDPCRKTPTQPTVIHSDA